jgi:hypothetical protein
MDLVLIGCFSITFYNQEFIVFHIQVALIAKQIVDRAFLVV